MFKIISFFLFFVLTSACSEKSNVVDEPLFDKSALLATDTLTVFTSETLIVPSFLTLQFRNDNQLRLVSNSRDFSLNVRRFDKVQYVDLLKSYHEDLDDLFFAELNKQIKRNEKLDQITYALDSIDYRCVVSIQNRKGLKNLVCYNGFVISDNYVYQLNTAFCQDDFKMYNDNALQSLLEFRPL